MMYSSFKFTFWVVFFVILTSCDAAWIDEKNSCLEEIKRSFIKTEKFLIPRPICTTRNDQISKLQWFGQHSYYDITKEEEEDQQHLFGNDVEESSLPPLPKKKLIHLWKANEVYQKTNEASSSSGPVYAFLAWERMDLLPFMVYPTVNGTRWSHRIMQSVRATREQGKEKQDTERIHTDHDHQRAFGRQSIPIKQKRIEVVEMETTYAIIRLDSLEQLLQLSLNLPIDTRMIRLNAIDVEQQQDLHSPFDEKNVTLPQPKFIPPLHSLLYSETIGIPRLREDARILTGEDEAGQRIPTNALDDSLLVSANEHWHSRHSATQEAKLAGAWLRSTLTNSISPLGGHCIEWSYDDAFAPNIVCEIPPANEHTRKQEEEEEGMVIISAHYDSRGTFGSTHAPGGDDDGSGTTMLLAIARHIGKNRIAFKRKVRLIAFSGEEQGLVGSKAYAEHLRKTQETLRSKNHPPHLSTNEIQKSTEKVYFMLQADMLGYRKPGEPLQVAFPDRLATKAATDYVTSIGKLYVPELQIGFTPACCSDHQSFWENGFTSTWVFERRGPIADPCYHQSCDLIDRKGYDFQQIQSITKLVLATLLDIGGGIDWPY